MVNLVKDALGWSSDRLRAYSQEQFGVSSWQNLSNDQKNSLVHKLRALRDALPDPSLRVS
jgi:hypothetical protein